MSINWDLYTQRLNINGISERERSINTSKTIISNNSINSPSYKNITVNGIEGNLVIIKATKDNQKIFHNISNLAIEQGSLIVWNNFSWLVISIDSDNEIYQSGKIQQCNYTLTFQNSKGEIITRPSIVLNASQYNSGIDDGKIMTIGSNQYAVLLPLDIETNYLTYDMRLFIDNKYEIPYKITRPDNVSNSFYGEGLLSLIMTQDELNVKKDRPDLHICDYVEPVIAPPVGSLIITHTGFPEIKCGGNLKSFTVNTTDVVTWQIIATEKQLANIIQEINGNVIKIKVSDQSLISSYIKLNATTVNSTGELLIKIASII